MGRRTILLIAALVVAALGTTLVWAYANRAENKALAGQEPVEVLVATADITAGTSGSRISEAAAVELRTLPAAAVPAGALSDLAPVSQFVTLGPVFTGQVLLQQAFGTQQQAAGGLSLPKGTMAVSVQLGDPQRVAGFVRPGSEVAVFTTGSDIGGVTEQQTTVLLPRALVVAVGPTVVAQSAEGSGNTEPIPTAILTFAVDQEEAQRLILATQSTQLYLALLDEDSKIDTKTAPATTDNLVG
jgi:pilus assembly protein CpaB